jgi:glycosyltransferase involved in cell wall biosynthesis
MPSRPKVSVIMPTYNQAEFIEAALDALEDQTFSDFELIVVNDGSTDGTKDVLDCCTHPNLAEVVHLEKNGGTAQAINAGIALARGEWFTWVSSDNEQYPDWLETLLAGVEEKDVGAIFSAYDRDRANNPDPQPDYELGMLVGTLNCFFGPSFLIHKKVWRAAGPHQGKISHDYDHWLRVEEVCMVSNLRIVQERRSLCLYKAHDKRVTITRKHEFDADHFQRAAIERRKANTALCLRDPAGVCRD